MDQSNIESQDIGNRMIVFPNGDRAWYQNKQIHRDGAPAEIGRDGSEAWYQHGKLHRTGGPAVVQSDGVSAWYEHDCLHRLDGPALIRPEVSLWFINNKRYTDNRSYQQDAGLTDEELLFIILKFGNVQ